MITMAGNMSVNLKSGGEMNIMSREKAQLLGYLDDYHLNEGYLVSFNFNEKKAYLQNKIVLEKK